MTANVVWIAAIIQRPGHPAPHLELGEPLRLVREALGEVGRSGPSSCRAGSRTPRATPARSRRRRRATPAARPSTFLRCVADPLRQPDEERQQREREDGEPPVEQEHGDDGREHRRHVREHRRRRRGDDVLDAADVVRDPALHLARARAREEREREPLQVPVDRGAQVVHDASGRPGSRAASGTTPSAPVTIGIAIIPATSSGQEADVLLRDRAVEHLAQQERRDHAERAPRTKISVQTTAEPAPVGAEEPDDPAQVGLADGGVGRPLGRPVGVCSEAMARHLPRVPAAGRPASPRSGVRRRGRGLRRDEELEPLAHTFHPGAGARQAYDAPDPRRTAAPCRPRGMSR